MHKLINISRPPVIRHAQCRQSGLKWNAAAESWTWEGAAQPVQLQSNFRLADSTLELSIFDEIGPEWVGVGAAYVQSALKSGEFGQIQLNINSPGGDVFEGIAIYNLLSNHPVEVQVAINGQAASIASVVAMSGDSIKIAEAGRVMIHNPWTFAMGEASEFRAIADTLDGVREAIIGVYHARTGSDLDTLGSQMDAETHFIGPQAVDERFADEIIPNKTAPDSGPAVEPAEASQAGWTFSRARRLDLLALD